MFLFLWLLLLTAALLLCSAEKVLPPAPPNNIFLLAGQSNMSGRGGIVNGTWDGVVPLECQPSPSILQLSTGLSWEEAHEPLHKDIDVNTTCGIGPGMSFANFILEKDPSFGVVGLVPCAVGGTNISEWGYGTFLYDQLVRRAQFALQGAGTIRALLWYQGETDASSLEDAKMYKTRLEKFFTDVRADLLSPMLPVIQVALASGGPYIDIVRKAQFGIGLPNVGCVDAKGLQLEPDDLHLTTPSQVHLGEMLAIAYLRALPMPVASNAAKSFHNCVLDFSTSTIRFLIRS